MPASDNILRVVERFERNREDYRRGRYNETQLRREFLDPPVYELYGLTDAEIQIVEQQGGNV